MSPVMTFLENIFERLKQKAGEPVLREIRDGKVKSVSGDELLGMVQEARNFLAARGLKKGERCALLGSNSIRWVTLDLAMMAEGLVVVPLYSRQAPVELVAMLKDSLPARICCSNAETFRGDHQAMARGTAHYAVRYHFRGANSEPGAARHITKIPMC